jgi:hypothetical protein
MLAEIFMVQLEATARVAKETPPRSNTQFVPFIRSGQFKDSRDRFVEPARDDGRVANR